MKSSIILSFLILAFPQNCSNVLFFQKDFEYYDGETLMHLSEYTIQNKSHENVISWIDYQHSFEVDSTNSIKLFFFRRNGDFSIANLLTEDVVFTEEPPILGINFIVRIGPGESFKYQVLNNEDIKDHLFFYKESEIIDVIGGPIINNKLFYRGHVVTITCK